VAASHRRGVTPRDPGAAHRQRGASSRRPLSSSPAPAAAPDLIKY
jgi:hypothetical protein